MRSFILILFIFSGVNLFSSEGVVESFESSKISLVKKADFEFFPLSDVFFEGLGRIFTVKYPYNLAFQRKVNFLRPQHSLFESSLALSVSCIDSLDKIQSVGSQEEQIEAKTLSLSSVEIAQEGGDGIKQISCSEYDARFSIGYSFVAQKVDGIHTKILRVKSKFSFVVIRKIFSDIKLKRLFSFRGSVSSIDREEQLSLIGSPVDRLKASSLRISDNLYKRAVFNDKGEVITKELPYYALLYKKNRPVLLISPKVHFRVRRWLASSAAKGLWIEFRNNIAFIDTLEDFKNLVSIKEEKIHLFEEPEIVKESEVFERAQEREVYSVEILPGPVQNSVQPARAVVAPWYDESLEGNIYPLGEAELFERAQEREVYSAEILPSPVQNSVQPARAVVAPW